VQDGFPDRQKQPRQGRTLQCEKRNSTVLLKYWDAFTVDSISLQQLDHYHEWRKRNIRWGKGDRAVDMELIRAVAWKRPVPPRMKIRSLSKKA
jgi:hypothetical protein